MPKDIIEHTKQQLQAMEEVLCALDKQGQRQVEEQQDEEPLKRAIRQLCLLYMLFPTTTWYRPRAPTRPVPLTLTPCYRLPQPCPQLTPTDPSWPAYHG